MKNVLVEAERNTKIVMEKMLKIKINLKFNTLGLFSFSQKIHKIFSTKY